MRIWIKDPLAILVDHRSEAGRGIVVKDSVIERHVATGTTPDDRIDAIFDASEHVVIPGLINTHHHYYQTLTRAVPQALNKPLFPWLKSLYPIWAGLTEEMISLSTQLAVNELLLSGCTTGVDHHYLYPQSVPHALAIQVEAVRQSGMRSVITRGSMSLGEDQGGLPPQNTVQQEDRILDDCERMINRYHDPSAGSMLQIALAPCSPFSVSESLMINSAELARQHGVRLHTHLAETQDETRFCLSRFGCRPVDYLERVQWLRDDVWLAHGIFFKPEEIIRLGKAGVGITHCPGSNMVLGSGLCPVEQLEEAGCPVGLGVDGAASNDSSNMIQEVRQALLLQRLHSDVSAITHQRALHWATKGSANCLGRKDIGEIKPGMQADLALYKLDELRFSGSGDPLAALILCGASQADAVMVAGEWKVRDRSRVDVDLDQLRHRHDEAAKQLQSGWLQEASVTH